MLAQFSQCKTLRHTAELLSMCIDGTPQYTVVIPAHNAEMYLAAALQSVISQTVPAREVIVVDDGSTDSTGDVARELGATVVTHESARGPAAARNAGVAAASTDLIAFLDADDEWHAEHASLLLAAMANSEVVFAAGKATEFGRRSGAPSMTFDATTPLNLLDALILENPIIQSGVFIRRDEFMRAGRYDESLRVAEDYDLWSRVAELGLFAPVAAETVRRRIHVDQLSWRCTPEMVKAAWFVRRRAALRWFRNMSAAQRSHATTLLGEAARRDIGWAVWTGKAALLRLVRAELVKTDRDLELGGAIAAVGGCTTSVARLSQDVTCFAYRVRDSVRGAQTARRQS
jgi:glycosyltransferase involved in cell wall biosynthesis